MLNDGSDADADVSLQAEPTYSDAISVTGRVPRPAPGVAPKPQVSETTATYAKVVRNNK